MTDATTPARHAALAGFTQQTHECEWPGCRTLVLKRFCKRHQPEAAWAISEEVRIEQERERDER